MHVHPKLVLNLVFNSWMVVFFLNSYVNTPQDFQLSRVSRILASHTERGTGGMFWSWKKGERKERGKGKNCLGIQTLSQIRVKCISRNVSVIKSGALPLVITKNHTLFYKLITTWSQIKRHFPTTINFNTRKISNSCFKISTLID